MDDVKNRMYNFETTPPEGVWNAIAAELDSHKAKVIQLPKKKNNFLYYAAASVTIIIIAALIFINRSPDLHKKLFTSATNVIQKDSADNKIIITVPQEEKTTAQNKSEKDTSAQKQINADNYLIASNTSRYITIEGPDGRPVKVSSKMTALINSSETKVSSKPVWNKKINEWKEIMKSSTLAPTTGNFLDIIELTKSLSDK